MFAVVSEYTRATDSNRNDTCQVLDAALSEGQLSTEEHRERVSAATKATTVGELRSLVADLQIQDAPVQLPALKSPANGWGIRIAVALVLVLLVAGIAWGLHRNDPSPSNSSASKNPSTPSVTSNNGPVGITTSAARPAPPPQLLTLSGLTGVLAQMRTQFGDTLGYQLNVYQDKAVLLRPDTANAHKIVEWVYRNDSWTNHGASTAVFSGSGVGDLGKFDVQAVLGVLLGAPQTLHLYDAAETFLAIESLKDGSLYLNIHVSDNSRRSGSIVVAADGSVTEISPPAR
jgi:hypothetical protein